MITVSFTVQFEEESMIAQENLENPLATFKITLTGTNDQVAGYICLFFAQYGGSGLGTEEMETVSDIWRDHYHYNQVPTEIEASGNRYIILLQGLLDYGVEFSTNNIAEFISGMLAVPPSLDNGIDVFPVQDPDWFLTAVYLDLMRDEDRDRFHNADSNPYEHAALLSTINAEVPMKMTVKVERQ